MPGEVLEVLEGKAAGRHIPVGDELIIGRGADENGRLADDPELSRRHARFSTDARRRPDGRGLRLHERDVRERRADQRHAAAAAGRHRQGRRNGACRCSTSRAGGCSRPRSRRCRRSTSRRASSRPSPPRPPRLPGASDSARPSALRHPCPAARRRAAEAQHGPARGDDRRAGGRRRDRRGRRARPRRAVTTTPRRPTPVTARPPRPEPSPWPRSPTRRREQSVEINVSGPIYDPEKGRDVNAKSGGTGRRRRRRRGPRAHQRARRERPDRDRGAARRRHR